MAPDFIADPSWIFIGIVLQFDFEE